MILCHSKEYIFFHAPKSGGTSVSVNLAKHTGPQDVVTAHEYIQRADHDFNQAKAKNSAGYSTHTLPYPTEYLSISTKRNPWDQVVSNFFWYSHKNFEEFVTKELFIDCRPFWGGMDFYLDFENLEESYKELCKKIDIPYERLPRTKTKIRPKGAYQSYYNDETRAIIESYYKYAIKEFNYKFDG